MTKHASSHIIADDFLPTTTADALLHAIVVELRALNARQDKEDPKPERKAPVKRAAPARTTAPKKEPAKTGK